MAILLSATYKEQDRKRASLKSEAHHPEGLFSSLDNASPIFSLRRAAGGRTTPSVYLGRQHSGQEQTQSQTLQVQMQVPVLPGGGTLGELLHLPVPQHPQWEEGDDDSKSIPLPGLWQGWHELPSRHVNHTGTWFVSFKCLLLFFKQQGKLHRHVVRACGFDLVQKQHLDPIATLVLCSWGNDPNTGTEIQGEASALWWLLFTRWPGV